MPAAKYSRGRQRQLIAVFGLARDEGARAIHPRAAAPRARELAVDIGDEAAIGARRRERVGGDDRVIDGAQEGLLGRRQRQHRLGLRRGLRGRGGGGLGLGGAGQGAGQGGRGQRAGCARSLQEAATRDIGIGHEVLPGRAKRGLGDLSKSQGRKTLAGRRPGGAAASRTTVGADDSPCDLPDPSGSITLVQGSIAQARYSDPRAHNHASRPGHDRYGYDGDAAERCRRAKFRPQKRLALSAFSRSRGAPRSLTVRIEASSLRTGFSAKDDRPDSTA